MEPTPLADTSAWIRALRSPDSWVSEQIRRDRPIAYSEPVLMEVMSGARTSQEQENTRRFLTRGALIPFDAASDFDGSARIYRLARRRGITPDSHVDCMIIAVALRNDIPLLTYDRQQALIAEIFGVELVS
jgi:predicted nucleic acid-binding protein